MGKINVKANKAQAGFTLVELAIVMIIIGLLIGGVLKGQELISNAQINATVAQVRGFDAATTTFRDTYNALPGDMANPDVRLPDCGAAPCSTGGNGNGRVDSTNGIDGIPAGEMEQFFVHLSAANLVAGINPNEPAVWGGVYPVAQITGGFHAAYDNSGALGVSAASRPGHYLVLNLTPTAAPDNTALSAQQAARIDRRMDDGTPETGTVIASDANCVNAGDYDEGDPAAQCDIYIRFQN